MKVLNKKKIPYYSCLKELNINDNKLYFLHTKEYANENDNSNVIYFNYNNHKLIERKGKFYVRKIRSN